MLDGSKKLKWYVDIGEEGKLLVRPRPCHLHPKCMEQDRKFILESCPSDAICGKATVVELHARGVATVPLTRNMVQKTGISIAEGASEGDFVLVEVSGDEFVPWLICAVLEEACSATLYDFENDMGRIEPGDYVIKLRAWEAAVSGERQFYQTDKVFWAFAEDLRLAIDVADFPLVERRASSRRTAAHMQGQRPTRDLTVERHADVLKAVI